MQKRKTFRYGYDAGDLVSSALSGWLFGILFSLFANLKADGGGLPFLVGSVSDWMRDPVDLFFLVAVTLFFLVFYSELIGLFPWGRKVAASVLLGEYLIFALILTLNRPTRFHPVAVLAALLVFLVPIVLRFVSTFRASGGAVSAPARLTGKPARFTLPLLCGILFACLGGAVVGAIGVMRYLNYSAPNFDFGIFSQAFADMVKTGAPVTTVERDGSLSHFAVHVSPILYLLLPFYFLFRTPITLAVGQAAILYSGVVPLLLVARRRGLSKWSLVLLSLAYSAYPAIGTGCFYDFHENCFLLPLLLFTFWFSECRRPIPFFIFACLTLTVKEDAFVYLAIFALFLLLSEKRWRTALPLFALSLGYFLLVSHLLQTYGEGVMSWRYSNLTRDGEGLFGVVLTVFGNPGYALTQLFSTTAGDGAKFRYLGTLLLPLLCLPCVTRRASRWILLSPLLLNLLTTYVYQPDVNFQYSFGIIAFLLYAAVLNLSELPRPAAFGGVALSAVACAVAFSILVLPMIQANARPLRDHGDRFAVMTETLDAIPRDASVAATTFLVPHLSDHTELYETYYHVENGRIKTDCDYYAFDLRYGAGEKAERQIAYLLSHGYVEYIRHDGAILVLVRSDLQTP